jgi:signal transduction histidine kinase
LVARGQTLGTVTFYTGFPYVFSDLDEALLWSLSARFASYWDKCQVIAEKEKAEADLEEIRYDYQNRLLESARQAAVRSAETQSTGLLHESKGTYTSAILTLDDAREAAPAERLRLIEQCLMILKAGEQRLDAPRLIDFASANAVDVNAQIRSVVGQRSQWKRERQFGIDFELKLEPVPPIDMSEEDVLEIVENLLSNSIRSIRSAARKQGEILIITRVVTAGKENELEIVVQDNGTGIRRDLLDEIFEKGFTTYKGAGGTGLGLYLVRGIITSYRGKIRAESQYGSWTRFTIRLPI